MASISKGNSVELRTFENYSFAKDNIIGFKTEAKGNKTFVNFVWCKLCAKHSSTIYRNPLCKGSGKKAADNFVNGTNYVSKWTIERHLGKSNF